MIWIAFTFGLVSSLHCLAMCGPLQAVVMGSWLQGGAVGQWLSYHLGRLLAYAGIGGLAALLGRAIGVAHWQADFALIAGITLLVGYLVLRLLRWDRQLYALLLPFFHQLRSGLDPLPRGLRFAGWGFLNGLLPCGMVYAAALTAMGAAGPLSGAAQMLAFGAGTLPLLFAFNLLGQQLLLRLGLSYQQLAPIAIVLLSSLLILRGMALDIPYLSPALPAPSAGAAGCAP
ncbi:MAG: sulfite exporter TauE/SafE family protein [Schleiferiaceae bacterium]|nr:sulfite exporter TauE/SafE family protein [Schleiferiaceae bacterium]MDR9442160.1 sulfite exporter TauE/SafE family protein [Schleiferiaceae bacterium]